MEAQYSNISRELRDGVCILTFDRRGSPANIFDRATLNELNAHLDFISAKPGLKGVILTSAKKTIFIAGADLKFFANPRKAGDLRAFVEFGQATFNRIEQLPVPDHH